MKTLKCILICCVVMGVGVSFLCFAGKDSISTQKKHFTYVAAGGLQERTHATIYKIDLDGKKIVDEKRIHTSTFEEKGHTFDLFRISSDVDYICLALGKGKYFGSLKTEFLIFDIKTMKIIKSISVDIYDPYEFVSIPSKRKLYLAGSEENFSSEKHILCEFDEANQITDIKRFSKIYGCEGISPDEKYMYLKHANGNIDIIDTITNKCIKSGKLTKFLKLLLRVPNSEKFLLMENKFNSKEEREKFFLLETDPGTMINKLVKSSEIDLSKSLAFSPDGRQTYLLKYLDKKREIKIFDTLTLKTLTTIPIKGDDVIGGVWKSTITQDGKYLILLCSGTGGMSKSSGYVVILDTESKQVTYIPIDMGPPVGVVLSEY
ncbi:MAG: hypothetical protein AB1414_01880 [bacterium]